MQDERAQAHDQQPKSGKFHRGAIGRFHFGDYLQSAGHCEDAPQCARIFCFNMQSAPSHQNNQNKYTHFSHALRTIWKEEGFKGFYSGTRHIIQDIELTSSPYPYFTPSSFLYSSTPKRLFTTADILKSSLAFWRQSPLESFAILLQILYG